MDKEEVSTDTLVQGIVLLSGLILFPVTLPIPLAYYAYRGWRARAPKREAKRREQERQAHELQRAKEWEAAQKHDLEMKRLQLEAEARKPKPPSPPTKDQLLAEAYQLLETEQALIDASQRPEDEKNMLRNQAMEEFLQRRALLLR